MATVVTLPRLSDTMEEGVIAKWRIKVGDKVKRGQVIADIETDKATMEFESFDAGTVLKLVAPEGEAMPVGAPIAVFGQPGESPDAAGAAAGAAPAAPAAPAPAPAPATAAPEAPAGGQAPAAATATAPAPEAAPTAMASAPGPEVQAERGRIPASPIARRLAREHDLDLGRIVGSGPHGRVVKADVEQAIAAGAPAAPRPAAAEPARPAPEPVPAVSLPAGAPAGELDEHGRPYISRPDRTAKLSQMRKTIAKRMGQSKREIPHIYLTMPITMDRAVALRAEFNLAVDGTKASLNDLVILAAAKALRKHPRVNAYFTDNGVVERGDVHIGVAVAVDDGLIVPPVRFADQKTLRQISIDVRDLGARARDKTLKPEEMTGSTFTVSNLGMFGIEEFCAIVNPGESAILAVGAVQDEAVVEDGKIVARKRMRVTLCSDHRVFDGAESARFLQTLRKLLENPLALLT